MTMRAAMVGQCIFIGLGVVLIAVGIEQNAWFYLVAGAACVLVFGAAFGLYAISAVRNHGRPSVPMPTPDAVPSTTARLVFYRTRRGGDSLRRYRIYVDEHKVGVLAPASTFEIDVRPGPHLCQARIDWSGSPRTSIDTRDGQVIRIRVARASTPTVASREGWLILDVDRQAE